MVLPERRFPKNAGRDDRDDAVEDAFRDEAGS